MKKITNKAILQCMDKSHDGFMISDAEGNFLYMNRAYRKLTKLEEKAEIGLNIRQFYSEGFIETEPTCLAAARKGETIIRLHSQNSNKVFIISTSEPIFDEDGNVTMVITTVRDVTDFFSLSDDMEKLRKMMEKAVIDNKAIGQYGGGIIAGSQNMREILETAKKVAIFDVAVLLTGESGTGKEVLAKYIHEQSNRAKKPFIAINCAAIPEQLLETELFGYEKGTFTGQSKEGKKGLFAAAEGGTLFLDEIGDMPLSLQAKLLRVLETKSYTPVGGYKVVPTDVRILSATNHNIEELIQKNKFREDLYYRLNVVKILLPPLRERKEDILPLAMYFLEIANKKYNLNKKFSAIALKEMYQYSWPGNVRELRNTVEMMLVVSQGEMLKTPDFIYSSQQKKESEKEVINKTEGKETENSGIDYTVRPLEQFMGEQEKKYLQIVYKKCGTTRKMAEELGINHSTVIRKMKKYGINATRKTEK